MATAPQLNFSLHPILLCLLPHGGLFPEAPTDKLSAYKYPSQSLFPKAHILRLLVAGMALSRILELGHPSAGWQLACHHWGRDGTDSTWRPEALKLGGFSLLVSRGGMTVQGKALASAIRQAFGRLGGQQSLLRLRNVMTPLSSINVLETVSERLEVINH